MSQNSLRRIALYSTETAVLCTDCTFFTFFGLAQWFLICIRVLEGCSLLFHTDSFVHGNAKEMLVHSVLQKQKLKFVRLNCFANISRIYVYFFPFEGTALGRVNPSILYYSRCRESHFLDCSWPIFSGVLFHLTKSSIPEPQDPSEETVLCHPVLTSLQIVILIQKLKLNPFKYVLCFKGICEDDINNNN